MHHNAQKSLFHPLNAQVAIAISNNSLQFRGEKMERFVPAFDVVAHEMNRRFRVRCSAGIVSRPILTTLVYQFIQQNMPPPADRADPAELNRDSAVKTPKRGAPPGNRNRLIHGRYAGDLKQLRADVRRFVHDALMMTGSRRLP